MTRTSLTEGDYRHLLEVRDALRRFMRWSEEQALAAGLTPSHHQLLLAVRGHPAPDAPTIGDIAAHLLVRHHSAVELVDRAAFAGLVRRIVDKEDHRLVRVLLTSKGEQRLERLAALHLEELSRLPPALRSLRRP